MHFTESNSFVFVCTEHQGQILPCKFNMPLSADYINECIMLFDSRNNYRNIPCNMPKTVVGQVKTQMFHYAFFIAFSRLASSLSCSAMILTSSG